MLTQSPKKIKTWYSESFTWIKWTKASTESSNLNQSITSKQPEIRAGVTKND